MTMPTPESTANKWLTIAPHVQSALDAGTPVVAFETTVLSFGLPYPQNMEVGKQCERMAYENSCTPATLGLLDGKVQVGISPEQMAVFCEPGAKVTKVNLQNMAAAATRREAGAFTVAASVHVCAAAGIRVFSTGGLGGVHRNYANLHDVSSDMIAMARYPVAVVCSGVKSILDVPATLEHLETLGVPIIGYKTKNLPLFHSRESLYPLETHSDSLEKIARMAKTH